MMPAFSADFRGFLVVGGDSMQHGCDMAACFGQTSERAGKLSGANVCFRPIADIGPQSLQTLSRENKPPSETALVEMRCGRVPHFFFHLYDDLVVRDEEGKELPDREAARHLGVTSARQMACAEVLQGHLDLEHRIEVEDDAGTVVAVIRFGEVITVTGG